LRQEKGLRIGRKILKAIGWIFVSLTILFVCLIFAIRIPSFQNFLVQKATTFLQNKIKTEVQIGRVLLSFPDNFIFENIYMADQQQDTLLYAHALRINANLWSLLENKIIFEEISINGLHATVSRTAEGVFNFDYIIDAFSDTTETSIDTTKTSWVVGLEKINLEDSKIFYKDKLINTSLQSHWKKFNVNFENFDLDKQIYKLDNVILQQGQLLLTQADIEQKLEEEKSENALLPEIGFNEILLHEMLIGYEQVDAFEVRADIDTLRLLSNAIDLNTQNISLNTLQLYHSFFSFHQYKMEEDSVQGISSVDTVTTSSPWLFSLDKIEFKNTGFQYRDFSKPYESKGFNPNHLWINNFNLDAAGIEYKDSIMGAIIHSLSFAERSGVSVKKLQGNIRVENQGASLNEFHLETPNSSLTSTVLLSYNSLNTIAEEYAKAIFDVHVSPSYIGLRDVLYFKPDLLDSLPLKLSSKDQIAMVGEVQGSLQRLVIDKLQASFKKETRVNITGSIANPLDVRALSFDIHVNDFRTTAHDIHALLVDSLIPTNIALPNHLSMNANVSGTLKKSKSEASISSTFGDITVNAILDSTSLTENYRANLEIKEFDLGRLLQDTLTYGSISLTSNFYGKGFLLEEMDAHASAQIKELTYQEYKYSDVNLHATAIHNVVQTSLESSDEHFDFILNAGYNAKDEIPIYSMHLDIRQIDFQALNLLDRPFKARGTFDANLKTDDFAFINGDIAIRKFSVFNGQALYSVDSLLVVTIDQDKRGEISIDSDIVTGSFKGTINLLSLPEVLMRHVNRYYTIDQPLTDESTDIQNFDFSLVLHSTELLTTVFFPGLKPFVPGVIEGAFNSEKSLLTLEVGISKIDYNDILVDSLRFRINSNAKKLSYDFLVKEVRMDSIGIDKIFMDGEVQQDTIYNRVAIYDAENKKYSLHSYLNKSEDNALLFHIIPTGLVLDYDRWTTPPDNYLRIDSTGLLPHNFEIARHHQKISLIKEVEEGGYLSLLFSKLNLSALTNLVEGIPPMRGLVDGDLSMSLSDQGSFDSRLTIQQFKVLDYVWGDFMLALDKQPNQPYDINASLMGDSVKLSIKGKYNAQEQEPTVSIDAKLNQFSMAAIAPLTKSYLRNLSGNLIGDLRIEGKSSAPTINGLVNFKNVQFTPTMINSALTLKNEEIVVQNSGFVFDDFKIHDRKGNLTKIDGKITPTRFGSYRFNVGVVADNFEILNSTQEDNDLFYGHVWMNVNAKITGSSRLPRISMNASLGHDSELTFVVPESEKQLLDQKGIVRFVDRDAKLDPFLASIQPKDTARTQFTGMEFTANIEVSDRETLNIVIDPMTGDKLAVNGDATLTLNIDQSGDMQLTGRYEISKGQYDMSFYKIVKREFQIEKGSSIVWSGDPMAGVADIQAKFEVETSPIDLVANQITPETKNMYKERVPFEVYLIMKGQIMSPDISFRLDMPENKQNKFGGAVYAKLLDVNTRESDLNKQVFSLLVLKRFMADNPFESQSGTSLSATARTSVSRLLSEQLNRLSENVKGIELSFDVKSREDFKDGQRSGETDVQLGVSKSLFNDRLILKVSGNVNVEGEGQQSQKSVADYIGDLALEYKITEDGRFRITGFRNSNYDMIDGDLIETGAGLIYIKDYDSFKELFKSNAEKE
jgi:translocation and assembly module TamB